MIPSDNMITISFTTYIMVNTLDAIANISGIFMFDIIDSTNSPIHWTFKGDLSASPTVTSLIAKPDSTQVFFNSNTSTEQAQIGKFNFFTNRLFINAEIYSNLTISVLIPHSPYMPSSVKYQVCSMYIKVQINILIK